jgi:membrane protein
VISNVTVGRGIALRRLLKSTLMEYERDYARYFAVAMVYYALMSLVPVMLLLLAALGWLLRLSPVAGLIEQQVLISIDTGFGPELRATVEQLLLRLQEQSLLSTIVSLIGLLFTASVLVRHLRMSFRAIWQHLPPWLSGSVRGGAQAAFREKVIAFAIVLGGAGVLLFALAAIAIIHWLAGLFGDGEGAAWMLALPIPLLLVFLVFALLFVLLPPVYLTLRHVWVAAALCTAVWIIGVEILTLYGAFFGRNLSTYGAIGGLLVIMLWMNAMSQVLFFGAELCKVVARDLIGPTANC